MFKGALAAVAIASAVIPGAVAGAGIEGLPPSLPPDPAVWQSMLSKLGMPALPWGARAYAINSLNACSGRSFIRVVVLPDGAAYAEANWSEGEPPAPLQPHEVDAFEAALRTSNFEAQTTGVADLNAVSGFDCYGVADIAENVEGRFRQAMLKDGALTDTVNALWAVVGARTGQSWATPSPWWRYVSAGAEVQLPDSLAAEICADRDATCGAEPWAALKRNLRLEDLKADADWRTYRLFVFSAGRRPAVVTFESDWTSRGRSTCVMICIDMGGRWVRVTSSARLFERDEPADLLDAGIGKELAVAGFATAPISVAGAAACGTAWVLEALVDGRYRYVIGDTCAVTTLSPVVTRMAKLGGVTL